MNANDVIESYVHDVAVLLPRRQRNDVAFELRALLDEELQGRAADAGRAPDAAMATELLRAFGRPADVAARYRPALTIIDPADGHAFVRYTVIGLLVIWAAGVLAQLGAPLATGGDWLVAIGRWWGGTVVASLWWPGVLVVGFAIAGWTRRRWPELGEWKPRGGRPAGERPINRVALVMGVIGILLGTWVLANPAWLLDVAFGGRAAPQAYAALAYTDTFRTTQAPWVFGVLLLNVPLLCGVIVKGRYTTVLRRCELALSLVTCIVLAWTLASGPVFVSPHTDDVMRLAMVATIGLALVDAGIKFRRRVRPAPAHRPTTT
jgi:hypothetical protein